MLRGPGPGWDAAFGPDTDWLSDGWFGANGVAGRGGNGPSRFGAASPDTSSMDPSPAAGDATPGPPRRTSAGSTGNGEGGVAAGWAENGRGPGSGGWPRLCGRVPDVTGPGCGAHGPCCVCG